MQPHPAAPALARSRRAHRRGRALPRLRHLRGGVPDRRRERASLHARAARGGDLGAARRGRGAVAVAREPRIVAFLCNWCAYQAADRAGQAKLQYPQSLLTVRVMCTGRVEPAFVLQAFREGADGVLVAGCHPGDCHYVDGNLRAAARHAVLSRALAQAGIEPSRFRIAWASGSEAARFAQDRHGDDRRPPRARAARLPGARPRAGGGRDPARAAPARRDRGDRARAGVGPAADRVLLERLLRRVRGGGGRPRGGARRAPREGGRGALAGRPRLQAPRRRGAARRRDRRRVPERRRPAHRAGRVGAAAPEEGEDRRRLRRLRPHGRRGRARQHVRAAAAPRRGLPAAALDLEPGRGPPRPARPGGRARPLPPGAPLPHAAARRGGGGRLRPPGLPAVARPHRRRRRAAPLRGPAAARRGARAERLALRRLPPPRLEAGADRDLDAAQARDDRARPRALLPRPGARVPRAGHAPGLPARLRRGGDAVPRLLRAARRRPGRGRVDALGLRLAPRGRTRPSARRSRTSSPTRRGPSGATRSRRGSSRAARGGASDAPDHHRPDHPARGARQDRGPPRRAGERADRVPADPGAARVRAVLRGARRGGDAAAHGPRVRGLPGGAPPRVGARARRALPRGAARRRAPDPGALLQPVPLRGPPPPLLVPRRPGLLRGPARPGADAQRARGHREGRRGARRAHPLGPQGGAGPHGGDGRADHPPGVRAAGRDLAPARSRDDPARARGGAAARAASPRTRSGRSGAPCSRIASTRR